MSAHSHVNWDESFDIDADDADEADEWGRLCRPTTVTDLEGHDRKRSVPILPPLVLSKSACSSNEGPSRGGTASSPCHRNDEDHVAYDDSDFVACVSDDGVDEEAADDRALSAELERLTLEVKHTHSELRAAKKALSLKEAKAKKDGALIGKQRKELAELRVKYRREPVRNKESSSARDGDAVEWEARYHAEAKARQSLDRRYKFAVDEIKRLKRDRNNAGQGDSSTGIQEVRELSGSRSALNQRREIEALLKYQAKIERENQRLAKMVDKQAAALDKATDECKEAKSQALESKRNLRSMKARFDRAERDGRNEFFAVKLPGSDVRRLPELGEAV